MVVPLPGQPVTARLFGKLPAHGDFVARGVAPAERAELDAWLTASLAAAQGHYADDFADRFDAALPWHGTGPASAGMIAASQDAAGRRFPLVLLYAAGQVADGEALLYAAIAERWDADRLVAAAGAAPAAPIAHWSSADEAASLAGARPTGILTAMLAT